MMGRNPVLRGMRIALFVVVASIALGFIVTFVNGGITGVMKLAHVAEGFGVDCEIHAPGHAPRHCMAAIRNTNYYELGLVHPKVPGWKSQNPIHADDYSDDLS